MCFSARVRQDLKKLSRRYEAEVDWAAFEELYPRALHEGRPDLIENSLPGAAQGQEHWLAKMPWMIFTRQFENQSARE
jgi:hypothetical protein